MSEASSSNNDITFVRVEPELLPVSTEKTISEPVLQISSAQRSASFIRIQHGQSTIDFPHATSMSAIAAFVKALNQP